jgi:putative tryptophan/tyrosine transport system substrate-binding protein
MPGHLLVMIGGQLSSKRPSIQEKRFATMRSRLNPLRRLILGIATIVAASAILLFSDLDSRGSADRASRASLRIAVVQHASIEALDEGIRGILDALAARGFKEGEGLEILRYNAQGDITTSNTIAKEVSGADLDMIITGSTVSLQTVANANRFQASPRRHVFGLTSNPFAAGVELSFEDRLDHPPYMAGLGSLPPVRDLFLLLQQIQPEARRVGLVWNPAEANSEAATLMARDVAQELGLTLVEGNAETSTAAGEVALSVMARGIDVLWVSPDITVSTALEVMVYAAQRSGVPVITSLPGSAARGSLLDLGANYYDVGFEEGSLAADILQGRDPATIPVENWMPVQLHVNLTALDGLRSSWVIPDSIVQRASLVIDESGTRKQDVPADSPPPSLVWKREGSSLDAP